MVQLEELVGQVRVVPVALADGTRQPLLEALAAKAEHPAGQRNGEALVGKRELHFGKASLAK